MGTVLEVVGANVTMAASAALAALSANTGDSLTIRSHDNSIPAYLCDAWALQTTTGYLQITSPRLHDNVYGLKVPIPAALALPTFDRLSKQMLYTTDVLTVKGLAGNSEVISAGLLLYYTDAPGMAARLASWEQVQPRIVNFLTSGVTMTAPATAGDWAAGAALNASSTGDLLKADTDYAVLGYATTTACAAIAVVGPDTGNIRAGGPGVLDSRVTRSWFTDLSMNLGMPAIPIIQGNNKGNTKVVQSNNAASGTPTIYLNLAELRPGA